VPWWVEYCLDKPRGGRVECVVRRLTHVTEDFLGNAYSPWRCSVSAWTNATRARSKRHPLAKRSVARINSSVMPGLLAACPASFTTTNSERGHRLCSFHAVAIGA